jgi:hypothetical protein
VSKATWVLLVLPARRVSKGYRGCKDRLAQPVRWARSVLRERRVRLVRQALVDLRARQGVVAIPEHGDRGVPGVRGVSGDHREWRDLWDLPALPGSSSPRSPSTNGNP